MAGARRRSGLVEVLLLVAWTAVAGGYWGTPHSWFVWDAAGAITATPAYADRERAIAWTTVRTEPELTWRRDTTAAWSHANNRRALRAVATLQAERAGDWPWEIQGPDAAGGPQRQHRTLGDLRRPPQFCVAVRTMERPAAPETVDLALTSLLPGLAAADLEAVHVVLFDAAHQAAHHDRARQWRARVPVLERSGGPSAVGAAAHTRALDHADALDYCVATGARFAVLL